MNIDTTIETCGYCNNDAVKDIAKYLDLIYFDLKHMDSDKHKAYTGVSNKKILENLKTLDSMRKDIIVRIPIIPGYNDSEDNIRKTAEYCLSLKSVRRIEILPYHNLGEYKYRSIGREYKLSNIEAPSRESMDRLCNIIKDVGMDCEIVMA